MQVYELTAQLEGYYEKMSEYADRPSLWQDEARQTKENLEQKFESLDQALEAMHEAQRISMVFASGLEDSQEFIDSMNGVNLRMWSEIDEPPADRALQDSLVDKLYFQDPQPDDKGMILVGDQSRYLALQLVTRSLEDGIPFNFVVEDTNFKRLVLNAMDESRLDDLAQVELEWYEDATKRMSNSPILTDYDLVAVDKDKQKAYGEKTAAIGKRALSGELDFALTKVPSRKDAQVDGFDYDEYITLFFEMCDQPWDHIDKAHRKLIEKLNKTKTIRFRNDDGTDISMELVDENGKDFTFCNSLIARNVPGSEVFSAPRIDSVNGTIVAEGSFTSKVLPDKVIKNLTLNFKDGYLESYSAEEGEEYFAAFVDRAEANRFVGELGIGTNPHLKRHVLNGLLVEKIGGSFHLALGQAYTMDEYGGEPVYVNNGNKDTTDHWDVTTLLYGKGGTIEADGELIMKDGKFLDPDLAVLNEGWAAVPANERPEYWKSFQGYEPLDGAAAKPGKPEPS